MPNPSRETKFSGANGDREMFIFPVQLTTSRIGSLTWLILTFSICDDDYIIVLVNTDLKGNCQGLRGQIQERIVLHSVCTKIRHMSGGWGRVQVRSCVLRFRLDKYITLSVLRKVTNVLQFRKKK